MEEVVVVDASRQFVQHVSPAEARRLLKQKFAKVLRKAPFTIQLSFGLTTVPTWSAQGSAMTDNLTPNTPTSTATPVLTGPGARGPMSALTKTQRNATAAELLARRRIGHDWNSYFREERDVWIQNLTDMQLSFDIEVGPNVTSPKLVPPTPDPINFTEEGFHFDILKKSNNLRKAHAKRRNGRPDFVLLDEEQVHAYYTLKAQQLRLLHPDGSPDIESALEQAAKTRLELTTITVDSQNASPNNVFNFAPPKSAQELISLDMANRGMGIDNGTLVNGRTQAGFHPQGQMMINEVVSGKIMQLCLQVSPQLHAHERMPEQQFMSALSSMPNLSVDDWQHVESHGNYLAARRFARARISEIHARELGAPDAPQGPTQPMTLAGQGFVGEAERRGALHSVPMAPVMPMGVAGVPQGFGPQGPATLASRGLRYEGPTGFANAGFAEAHGAGESSHSQIIGPDGRPLG